MANLGNFDANKVDPVIGFDPIPEGTYTAAITASEMMATKSGSGEYLQLEFQILSGEHKGRNLWARLNLHNQNQTAVKMARGELSAICRAVGVMQPKDSIDLHNIPLMLKVALKKREDNGEMTNVIKGYDSASAPTAQKAADAAFAPAPWKKSK